KLKETSDERGETNKIKCNNCDHMISNELEKCPNCHIKFDNENPSNKKAKNEDLEELYKEGVINVQIGNYQQAEKELKEYIKEVNDMKKESEEEWYTFNNCIELMLFAKENDLSEKNIVDVNYNSSNAYFYLSVINFEKKEYDDAIKNLNKSLKWNPYNIHALFEKAENFKVKGDLKKYYSLTLDLYDKIYNLEDLAHYYRNLGYYFIETENLYLANAVYLYSIKFENNSVAFDELKYVISKSKNKVTIAKEELEDIMKENRIPTCISKEIIKSINNLYKKFIKEEQENTPAGKLLRNLVDELK
ncbi:MAG: hypothetical protein RSE48_05005, partial [Bacilli bacterium]